MLHCLRLRLLFSVFQKCNFSGFSIENTLFASVEVLNSHTPDVTAMPPYQRAAVVQANVQRVCFSLSVFRTLQISRSFPDAFKALSCSFCHTVHSFKTCQKKTMDSAFNPTVME